MSADKGGIAETMTSNLPDFDVKKTVRINVVHTSIETPS